MDFFNSGGPGRWSGQSGKELVLAALFLHPEDVYKRQALRTKLGATLLFGVLKPTTAKTAYFHCLSLHLRMQK